MQASCSRALDDCVEALLTLLAFLSAYQSYSSSGSRHCENQQRRCMSDVGLKTSGQTCTCVPGRVEPASSIALTTSRTEAPQARRSSASSLDTFTQSLLHRAWPKTRGPESGFKLALIVVAYVFSWPPTRLRHVRGGDQLTYGTSCSVTRPAEPSLLERCQYSCKAEAAPQFHGWHVMSLPTALLQ